METTTEFKNVPISTSDDENTTMTVFKSEEVIPEKNFSIPDQSVRKVDRLMLCAIFMVSMVELSVMFPILIYNLYVKTIQPDIATYEIIMSLSSCFALNVRLSLLVTSEKKKSSSSPDDIAWMKMLIMALTMTLNLHIAIGLNVDAQMGFALVVCLLYTWPFIMYEYSSAMKSHTAVSLPLVTYAVFIVTKTIRYSRTIFTRIFPMTTIPGDDTPNPFRSADLGVYCAFILVFIVLPMCSVSAPFFVLTINGKIRRYLLLLVEAFLVITMTAIVCTPGIYISTRT